MMHINNKILFKMQILFISFSALFFLCSCAPNEHKSNFKAPEPSQGPWTPVPKKHSHLLSVSKQTTQSSLQKRSNLRPEAAESRSYHIEGSSSHLPTPIIKHHANGATVGLDIPDSNLRLLLDIDDFASKPSASQIGVKLYEKEHNHHSSQSRNIHHISQPQHHNNQQHHRQQQSLQHSSTNQLHASPVSNTIFNVAPAPMKQQFPSAPAARLRQGPRKPKVFNTPSTVPVSNNFKIGLIRTEDLHKAISSGILNVRDSGSHSASNSDNSIGPNNQNSPISHQRPNKQNIKSNSHIQRIPVSSNFRVNDNKPIVQEKMKFSQPLILDSPKKQHQFSSVTEMLQKIKMTPTTTTSTSTTTTTISPPSTESKFESPANRLKAEALKANNTIESSENQKPKSEKLIGRNESKKQEKDSLVITPREPSEKQSFSNPKENANQFGNDYLFPETEQKTIEGDDDYDFGTESGALQSTTVSPPPMAANLVSNNVDTPSEELRQQEQKEDDEQEQEQEQEPEQQEVQTEDFGAAVLQPFPAPVRLESCSSKLPCESSCAPMMSSLTDEPFDIKSAAETLHADEIFNVFPSLEDRLQSIVDFGSPSYTIFLPSNDALARLPLNLIEQWKENASELNELIDNHVIDAAQTVEEMRISKIIEPRSAGAILRVNSNKNQSYTVNGQRIIYGDQKGPVGGMIQVIDGILYPKAEKNIMDTLKACNRFDGFVTLAEGTGLSDTLSSGGPWTVFVPSNEALQKIPDADLEQIRNNMTALKEFLMYHVADGSFYSADLKDGQFIPSLLGNNQIQVGIRVDGCSRRIVEANVSPLYRADIPASNGVIHVVDWILKPNDRDWCENIILPR